MKTLIVSAGGVGGYFGARLIQAGRGITFLVRSVRAAQLAATGLRIHTTDGGSWSVPAPTVSADTIPGGYDLVLLTVKAYGLGEALNDLAPAVGPGTVIIPFLNGMAHLDILTDRFGPDRIFGGVCHIGAMIDDDGGIAQFGTLAHLTYGPLDGQPSTTLDRVQQTLAGAGFAATASLRIRQEMWNKWVLLASLAAVTCLMRGSIGDVNAVPGGAGFAAAVLGEATAIAAAAGYPAGDDFSADAQAMITKPGSAMTSSMYRDLAGDRPVEADQILGDFVGRARSAGVAAPLLNLAYTQLAVYERTHSAP